MGANDKVDATCHGGEYTPSTDSARRAYVFHTAGLIPPPQERAERRESEFTRWLETVRAEAKAEALTEAASEIDRLDSDVEMYDENLNAIQASDWLRSRAEQNHGSS